MNWMWAFFKATLIPGLIVGIGVALLYHALFESLPLRRVRRTKHYHTRRLIDRHHHRANVHQGNDGIYRGRPLHEKTPNAGNYHRVEKKESLLEREIRRNRCCPPKPPRPRPSNRKDGYGNKSHEKEEGLKNNPLDLHLFQDFFNSLPLRCNEESKPQVNNDHDGWEIESDETLNDGPKSLDKALLHTFTKSLNPLAAYNKIKPVALLAATFRSTKKAKRDKTYCQALLSAAMLTGDAVSTTASVYIAHKD
jgi:hypothetical protein